MNTVRNSSRALLGIALTAVTAWLVVQNVVLMTAFALRAYPKLVVIVAALGKAVWLAGSLAWPVIACAFGVGLVYGAIVGAQVRRTPGRVVSRV